MLQRALIVFSIAFLSACSTENADECAPQEKDLAALKELLKLNPEELAQSEAKLTNPKFYAIRGYGLTVVGIDENLAGCAIKKNKYKYMPGTSDYLCTNEIVNLQPAANHFAEHYNLAFEKLAPVQCP